MDKKTAAIIGVIVTAFFTLLAVSMLQHAGNDDSVNYHEIVAASENSGGFEETIMGDPNAPVKIFEYGDYQCTACAPMNPYIKKLVEEYDGKVAVVFRTFILSYHNNGTAAASAALAAAKQGYWTEMKDLMFENQSDWYYSDATQRQAQFEEYFERASDGKGDLAKFREDMGSEAVRKKISFDRKIYEKVTAADGEQDQWTPMFYLDGELIDQRQIKTEEFLDKLREKIDAKLKG